MKPCLIAPRSFQAGTMLPSCWIEAGVGWFQRFRRGPSHCRGSCCLARYARSATLAKRAGLRHAKPYGFSSAFPYYSPPLPSNLFRYFVTGIMYRYILWSRATRCRQRAPSIPRGMRQPLTFAPGGEVKPSWEQAQKRLRPRWIFIELSLGKPRTSMPPI